MTVAHLDTVLVVEDDPGIRRLMSRVLRHEGFQVEEAPDGPQALQALERPRSPSDGLCLMVLDLLLPTMSGVDVLRYLAQQSSQIPVVAMSANHEALEAAAAAGAQATLEKPIELDRLLEVVGRCCPH